MVDLAWEYVQGSCDVWQVGHLCNHFAEYGWEPVMVFDSAPSVTQVSKMIGDDNGPLVPALRPTEVLFRRPAGYAAEESVRD